MMEKSQFEELLNEVFIRFNTSPRLYLKKDYLLLLELIKKLGNQIYPEEAK